MNPIELETASREIQGKKVRFLRRQGITPLHLFGHSVESLALQCDTVRLQRVLAQVGKTGLISLKLDKAKKARNVLVREVQKDPRTGELIHVDLYQVRAEEKIKVEVPIVLVGEAPALKLRENILVQELTILSVECLPDRIPASIELDISLLAEAEQAIRVKDITLGEGITVSLDPEHVVAKVTVTPLEEAEEAVEAVAAEVEAEEAAPLPAEGAKKE